LAVVERCPTALLRDLHSKLQFLVGAAAAERLSQVGSLFTDVGGVYVVFFSGLKTNGRFHTNLITVTRVVHCTLRHNPNTTNIVS